MTSPTSLRFTALSDVGRVRRDNQDSGYAGPHLLVVADGVGGAARGDIASSVAIEAIRRLDTAPTEGESEEPLGRLAHAIHLAHDRLSELVEQYRDLDGTSTTVTAALFDGTELHVGHVGDSRGYLLREGRLEGLTTDHTLVQSLVDEGRITEAEARVHPHRNLILKAVDGVHEPEPDLFTVPLLPGDRLLLCSDGCSGSLDNETMAAILGQDDLEDAAAQLVRAALEAGSSDNITVVVAAVQEGPETGPEGLVVGAAAAQPQLRLDDPAMGRTETGSIPEDELGDLDGGDLDLEELRYAPRPPRRFTWLRRLLVAAVVLGLLIVAGTAFRGWAQQQYYVGDDDGDVVVFRGLTVELPWISPREVAAETGIRVEDLQDVEARAVRDGIPVAGVAAGRRKASELRLACPEETPSPATTTAPTPSGTPSPTGKAGNKGKAGKASTTTAPATPSTPTATDVPCDEAP